MNRTPFLAAPIALLLAAAPAMAQEAPTIEPAPYAGPPRVIAVTGSGAVETAPDSAWINAGVESRADDAAAAMRINSEAMEKVLAAVKEGGVADGDVQTSSFSISPVYTHDPEGRTPPKVTGYQASNQVRVKVRQLDRAGTLLDQLIRAGANAAGGLEFVVEKADEVEREALKAAVADARARAEAIAAAAGVQLGPVLSVKEASADIAPPPHPMVRSMMAADKAVPIAAGRQSVGATVTVRFAVR